MSVKVKAFQFAGNCTGCRKYAEKARGGIAVILEAKVDDGDWICLACASLLTQKLEKAIRECKANIASGQEYRNDRWQPRQQKEQ